MARKRHSRRRRRYVLAYVLCTLCIIVTAMTVALAVGEVLDRVERRPEKTLAMSDSLKQGDHAITLDNVSATEAPAVSTPEPTAQQTPEPTVAPAPVPTEAPVQAAASFEYLPIVHHGMTDSKRIAITVDDCFQIENLKKIAATAYQNGGKLTLFPIGENVMKPGMADVLKACVFNMGFEIENHTWSHARVFRLPEEKMASEIWKQSVAVSMALGVNYQQHFFRLMGGDGEKDQRTHNYLEQLGFLAIADWSISGSDATMEQIQAALKPGAIYLFHTTDSDTKKLMQFIPYAVSQGYELVTLNELCGQQPNAMTDLSTLNQTMPEPRAYTVEYQDQKKGDYSWSVVRIQQRLAELGYLDGNSKSATKGNPADGVYGDSTVNAISRFQRDSGLPATGVADVETQKRLLGN